MAFESTERTEPTPTVDQQDEPSPTSSVGRAISGDAPTYMMDPTTQLDPITEPGCYLCHWNGRLLRVCAEERSSGQVELTAEDLSRPPFVTKLSDNPYITYTKARMLAANRDLDVDVKR